MVDPARAAPNRRERRKQEVHERILSAAFALFARQGFQETTVDEIVEQADVAQKTFFNHFPTKQDLLCELAEARLGRLQEILQDERRRAAPTRERLERVFRRLARDVEETGRLSRDLILESIRILPPDGAGSDFQGQLHASFGALLRDGARAGEMREDLPVEFLAEMVVGGFSAVMINSVTFDDYPVEDRLGHAARFLGEALAPRPLASGEEA